MDTTQKKNNANFPGRREIYCHFYINMVTEGLVSQ